MKKYIDNKRKRIRSGITKERERRKEINNKIKEEGGADENLGKKIDRRQKEER